MKWSSILPAIGKLAPTIASAVGGPLAGVAVTSLEGALGMAHLNNSTATLEQRQQALADQFGSATPEQLLALRKADQDFQEQMSALGFKNASDILSLESQDRANARGREISLKDYTPRILAFSVLLAFIGLTIAVQAFSEPRLELIKESLLTLRDGLTYVLGYYFGSSAGRDRQSENSTPASK